MCVREAHASPGTHHGGDSGARGTDLSPATRGSRVAILNEHLADAVDLPLQAKQAHWKIKGPSFVGVHELSERVTSQARGYADEMAERAVAVGGVARGTVQAVSAHAQLREYPRDVREWRDHMRAREDALATFGRGARKPIADPTTLHDADTADLSTEFSRR